jgi:16S rRNA (guanine527-N7)-methyltransferase
MAIRYAELLATEGVVRGLIGPRESDRLWDRHLLNCAVLADLIGPGASVIDVGSGAGLPGIVLAVARPDLTVVLVEPLARRAAFLSEVVDVLGLEQTTVVRGRAEELVRRSRRGGDRQSRPVTVDGIGPADVVTARAVAVLDRLVAWCLPLAAVGGTVLAMKGESAAEEVENYRSAVTRAGGGEPVIRLCGADVLETPTTIVEITRVR